jgi:hypothetical protein
MPEPTLHQVRRHQRLKRIHAKAVAQSLWHGWRTRNMGRRLPAAMLSFGSISRSAERQNLDRVDVAEDGRCDLELTDNAPHDAILVGTVAFDVEPRLSKTKGKHYDMCVRRSDTYSEEMGQSDLSRRIAHGDSGYPVLTILNPFCRLAGRLNEGRYRSASRDLQCGVTRAGVGSITKHFSDLPVLAANVGYEGESGSGSDIAKPARLTHLGLRPDRYAGPTLHHFSLAARSQSGSL